MLVGCTNREGVTLRWPGKMQTGSDYPGTGATLAYCLPQNRETLVRVCIGRFRFPEVTLPCVHIYSANQMFMECRLHAWPRSRPHLRELWFCRGHTCVLEGA